MTRENGAWVKLDDALEAVRALPPVHENCPSCDRDPLLQGSDVLAALQRLGQDGER